MPLTSCAVTWKSSLHKSPDYPDVAEIDPRISESNTLREAVIVECNVQKVLRGSFLLMFSVRVSEINTG